MIQDQIKSTLEKHFGVLLPVTTKRATRDILDLINTSGSTAITSDEIRVLFEGERRKEVIPVEIDRRK